MPEIDKEDAANAIIDLHKGVHAALDALVTGGDADKAETILRQLDQRLSILRREAKRAQWR